MEGGIDLHSLSRSGGLLYRKLYGWGILPLFLGAALIVSLVVGCSSCAIKAASHLEIADDWAGLPESGINGQRSERDTTS